jgi:hypothetical protein
MRKPCRDRKKIHSVSPLQQNKYSRVQSAEEKPGDFQVPLFRQ